MADTEIRSSELSLPPLAQGTKLFSPWFQRVGPSLWYQGDRIILPCDSWIGILLQELKGQGHPQSHRGDTAIVMR